MNTYIFPETLQTLIQTGQLDRAIALSQSRVDNAQAGEVDFYDHARLLKYLSQPEAALAYYHKAILKFPTSAYAWHNLAAHLGDMHQAEAAFDASQTAQSLGLNGLETQLIKARALSLMARFTESETAYREILGDFPNSIEAVIELAQLIWMQTGDKTQASEIFRQARLHNPDPILAFKQAHFYSYIDAPDQALAVLRPLVDQSGASSLLLAKATEQALALGNLDQAKIYATRAYEAAPESIQSIYALFCVLVAQGEAMGAAKLARYFCDQNHLNQLGPAMMYTAARLRGHHKASQLYNYADFVGVYKIETPSGWSSLEAYLEDLAIALQKLHPFKHHPLDQSIRDGTQTQISLNRVEDPAIKAYFAAIHPKIHQHMEKIGQGEDELRFRNTGSYRVQGAWSIWMRNQGRHVDHIHNEGWLSSAFYVKVPEASADTTKRQGWLKFGQPPMKCMPPLDAEFFVQPKPGHFAVFPSYMWHGTTPFDTPEDRVTIAIDLSPA